MTQQLQVLIVTGGKYHDWEAGGQILASALEQIGAQVTRTQDAAAFDNLRGGGFNCVVLYTQGDRFNESQIENLTQFVRAGGGLVGIHSANATNRDTEAFTRLIGSRFDKHGPVIEYTVHVSDGDHPIGHRIQDYRITDELYVSESKNDFHPFLTAWWDGKPQPIGYTRNEGKGRVVYLANGHTPAALSHPTVLQMFRRAARYAAGEDWSDKTMKVGVVGYGGAFGMGKRHAESCRLARLDPIAVCDPDTSRLDVALADLGEDLLTFDKLEDMLENSDVELAVVITPHNTHAPLSIQCLKAGRHVVTEKPYTITVDEATQVIETARRANRMATVFHNRRWDGDFMTIRKIVESGAIGEVFHVECFFGGYGEQRTTWWRSYKETSGGVFYDWGAHFCDWVLNLMPYKIESISGSFQKRKWKQVSNEDHAEAFIRFEGGRTAHIENSTIAAIKKSRFRILGTLGGIEQKTGKQEEGLRVVTYRDGLTYESTVPNMKSDWDGFYRNVADHLLLGEPLAVTPESARKVIAVLSLAEQSHKQGGAPIPIPFDQ